MAKIMLGAPYILMRSIIRPLALYIYEEHLRPLALYIYEEHLRPIALNLSYSIMREEIVLVTISCP